MRIEYGALVRGVGRVVGVKGEYVEGEYVVGGGWWEMQSDFSGKHTIPWCGRA